MRIRLLATLMLLGLLGETYACKCNDSGTVEGSFNISDIVVSGRVLTKEIVPYSQTVNPDSVPAIKARFQGDKRRLKSFETTYLVKAEVEIVEKYKGVNLRDTVTIFTAVHSASCGYKFEVGRSYIIYASRRSYLGTIVMAEADTGKGLELENTYWTNICTRTAEYDYAEAAALRALMRE